MKIKYLFIMAFLSSSGFAQESLVEKFERTLEENINCKALRSDDHEIYYVYDTYHTFMIKGRTPARYPSRLSIDHLAKSITLQETYSEALSSSKKYVLNFSLGKYFIYDQRESVEEISTGRAKKLTLDLIKYLKTYPSSRYVLSESDKKNVEKVSKANERWNTLVCFEALISLIK